jgi:hypothetical protein
MRPLIRYTLGKVSKSGWETLSESIRLIKKIYPEFDLVVCYNNLNAEEIRRLESFDVPILDQSLHSHVMNFVDENNGWVRNFFWKLIPQRLRIDAHELWVDNDIVFFDRVDVIDNWLNQSTGIISEGFNKDYGRFGSYPELKNKEEAYCAGFFGLPPHFDFATEIKKLAGDEPLKNFDEQGLVSLVVSRFENYIVARPRNLVLLSETWKPQDDFWFPKGIHFARVNCCDSHVSWRTYKLLTTP